MCPWRKSSGLRLKLSHGKGDSGNATGGIGTAGREAASGVEGAMAVACRRCYLYCVVMHRMLLSFVPVDLCWYISLYQVYSSNHRYQVLVLGIRCSSRVRIRCTRGRARVPSPPRSSLRSEPEPSSLDSEMDDTLSLPGPPREPEHPSMSLGCRAFAGGLVQQLLYQVVYRYRYV